MTLTSQQVLHFSNEWSASQIDDFARRLVAATNDAARGTVLAEFKANLPDPDFDTHPQSPELSIATFFCSKRSAS